ncbi:hypothetical protein FB451DRAFT_1566206, partial [Mycena latifolia]
MLKPQSSAQYTPLPSAPEEADVSSSSFLPSLIVLYESSSQYHPDRLAHALAFLDGVFGAQGRTSRRRALRPRRRVRVPPAEEPAARPRHGRLECAGMGPRVGRARGADGRGAEAVLGRAERRDELAHRVHGADSSVGMAMCEPANVRGPSLPFSSLYPRALFDVLFVQYLLLFPNENAIWALFCRLVLRTHFCGNVAGRAGGVARDAGDPHGCNLHTAVTYLCRKNVSNAQMIITKMRRRALAGEPPRPAVQSQAGDRKSGLRRSYIYSFILFLQVQYQNEVIQRVTLSIHPSNTSPIRGGCSSRSIAAALSADPAAVH